MLEMKSLMNEMQNIDGFLGTNCSRINSVLMSSRARLIVRFHQHFIRINRIAIIGERYDVNLEKF